MNSKRTRKRYNKNSKILIIMVLAVGVIGLSIGFSAFSKNLDINSTATVTPDSSDFKILFSSQHDKVVDGTVSATKYASEPLPSFSQATIDNSNPTSPQITGLKVTFTNTGTSGQYIFYAFNEGRYDAYLKKITFGNKKCTAKEGTSQALVDEVCGKIQPEVQIAGSGPWYKSTTNLTEHLLKKGTSERIAVWIGVYSSVPHLADGDFDIEFGDITLTYSTTDS